jgi:hypothetical protein
MIKYPSHILPAPLLQPYGGTHNPYLSKSEFEVGVRQRAVYSVTESTYAVQIRPKDEFQLEFFKSWHANILFQGSMKFLLDIPGVDGIVPTEVFIVDGVYDIAPDSNRWLVSFNIRVEDPVLADADVVEILASLEDGTPEEFSNSMDILWSQLNFFYGQSEDSPQITNFINTYG